MLGEINQLDLRVPEGAFAYPLMIENGAVIRKKLQQRKIYVPTLWPNIIKDIDENNIEHKMANDILPLPCDQRYESYDLEFIIKEIKGVVL